MQLGTRAEPVSPENTSKREAEKIVLDQASESATLKPDRIRTVTETKVEIKFIADQSLVEKIEKLKGLLAHTDPSISMAELVEKLCDMGLGQLDPALARRRSDTARKVWSRAEGKCQNCGSQHALQVDHIKPKALGGGDDIENLRLLCRSCNQRAAIQKLGLDKMQPYLERPPCPLT